MDDLTDQLMDDLTGQLMDDLTDQFTDNLTDQLTDDLTDQLTDKLTGDLTDQLADDLTDQLTDDLTDQLTDDEVAMTAVVRTDVGALPCLPGDPTKERDGEKAVATGQTRNTFALNHRYCFLYHFTPLETNGVTPSSHLIPTPPHHPSSSPPSCYRLSPHNRIGSIFAAK